MNAKETLDVILNNQNLVLANLKYCLVSFEKFPYTIANQLARTNHIEDFVTIDKLILADLEKYAGVGISIQASNICAIDVDDCFSKAFDVNSIDDRGKDIINRFKDLAYIEFSFSGHGLRILFRQKLIDNYSNDYYIKNEKNHIEYYQPSNSNRYVTLTGRYINNNLISSNVDFFDTLIDFLNTYMKREKREKIKVDEEVTDNRTIDELLKKVKTLYLKNFKFQDVWFSQAPGSGSDESERDYYLISMIYENITQDKEKIKLLFEASPFFKSKDNKHLYKWNYANNRYYNYVFERVRR